MRKRSKETLEKCRRGALAIRNGKGQVSVRQAAEFVGLTFGQLYYFIRQNPYVGTDGPGRKPDPQVDIALKLFDAGFGSVQKCAKQAGCYPASIYYRMRMRDGQQAT